MAAATETALEFTAPSDATVEIIEAWLTQDSSETSLQEVVQICRKSAAGTGTSYTPKLLAPNNDAAFGGTARIDCTAEGTVGDILHREGFNILNGWFYKPLPESRILVPPSGIVALRGILSAGLTVSAGMVIEER